ncbi:hypothetical protein KP509_07G035900 [Ceratopteris richardii]|nr:hypothetical protein KP509_07G035900 [Ceratopteris richardii]
MSYIANGEFHSAFGLYERMQQNACSFTSALTLLKLLQVCTELRDIHRGQKLHADFLKSGLLQHDLFIGSALVEFYAKIRCLLEAQVVFDELTVHDVVLWTTLIGAYVEQGYGVNALHFFKQMQDEGLSPDVVAFAYSLKACTTIQEASVGEDIHNEIVIKGLDTDRIVSNTLVDMYIKCGFLNHGRIVFDKLVVRDVVTWNVLITGYVDHGYEEMALRCYHQMQQEGICPDDLSLVASLRACSSIQSIESGQDIHLLSVKLGLEGDLFVSNTLVDMYAKCGLLAEAQTVFDGLSVRDEVSWNALLSGYADHGCVKEALECFEQVKAKALSPHIAMFICAIKACGSVGVIRSGEQLYSDIIIRGLEGDVTVCNSLIYMYANCNCLTEAEYLFHKIVVKSEVSWNTMIAAYWDRGQSEEALDCYGRLQNSGSNPGSVTVVCSLKACGSMGTICKGNEIHMQAAFQGIEKELYVGNTLVDMYAKCGCLSEAQKVFNDLSERDNVSYNALITGWAQLGESRIVLEVFERMIRDGIDPDFFTFINILNACCHAGLLEEGQLFFHIMTNEFCIVSTPDHHSCLVNLFGRAGLVHEAVIVMNRMPFHPNIIVWHIILAACQKWGNAELGLEAFEHTLQLNEMDTAAYFCMCNIYSESSEG